MKMFLCCILLGLTIPFIMDVINNDSKPIIRPLSPALQEIAEQELNEDSERLIESILLIRRWINEQKYLKARTNDQFLVAFLRGCKYSLERTKQKIDRFYSLRAHLPEIYNEQRSLDNPQILEIVRLGIILQLPLPHNESIPCLTIIRATAYDIDKYKFADIIRVGSMFGEIMMLEDDHSTVCGYYEIMDMINVTAGHLFHLPPDLLRKFSRFAHEALPMRQCGTFFINVPSVFDTAFNTMKALFPDKVKNRIIVSSTSNILNDYIPENYLPIEYGGTNGSIQDIIDAMERKLLRYRDYFNDDCNYGTDESLRDHPLPFNYDSYFGIHGTFRQLNYD